MDLQYLPSLGTFSRAFSRQPTSVAVDSRLVLPGALFFALAGEKVDGHEFLDDAWKKGASGAIIREDFSGDIAPSFPVMRVKNPLSTLQQFAKLTVAGHGAKVCALTGSVGKTTTKDFIAEIVAQGKKVFATQGNQNSQIGLALSLLNGLQGGEEWIIAEMGMTHAGDIAALTTIAPPDVALITSVCLVHIENFRSLEEIAMAKAEIFVQEKTSQCLFNADTAHAEVLMKHARGEKKAFSMKSRDAFWSMRVLENELIVSEDGREYVLPKPLFPAPHVYENLLAAIAASRSIGVSWEQVCAAIPHLRLPALRLEHTVCRGIRFINDSYNACEPSMIAALNVLKNTPGLRKIAVLGAMKELGSFSQGCHQHVWEKACEVADAIYCLGQEWQPMVDIGSVKKNMYFLAPSRDELICLLEQNLREGDTVLLKGSRWANQLWKVQEHFSG